MKDLEAVLIYSCQGAAFGWFMKMKQRREAGAGGITPFHKFTTCGGNGLRVPPVPIPNTEVKPSYADNTGLETAREDR